MKFPKKWKILLVKNECLWDAKRGDEKVKRRALRVWARFDLRVKNWRRYEHRIWV